MEPAFGLWGLQAYRCAHRPHHPVRFWNPAAGQWAVLDGRGVTVYGACGAGGDWRTPRDLDRERAEAAEAALPRGSWGPFHRHFAGDAVHRDGMPECDQPGTPRGVYVFAPEN